MGLQDQVSRAGNDLQKRACWRRGQRLEESRRPGSKRRDFQPVLKPRNLKGQEGGFVRQTGKPKERKSSIMRENPVQDWRGGKALCWGQEDRTAVKGEAGGQDGREQSCEIR